MPHLLGRVLRLLVAGWFLAGVFLFGLVVLYEVENELYTLPFSLSVLMTLAALLFLLSRRVAFSLYAAWALLGTITLVSIVKFKERGFDVHAYDVVFVGGDVSLYNFLFRNYLHLMIPVAGLVAAAVAALVLVVRLEPARRVPLAFRAGGLVFAAALLPITIPATVAADRHEYIVGGHHASAFFVSLLDLPGLLGPSPLTERLAGLPPQEPFADTAACSAEGERPDVLFVLSETQAPPVLFPQLGIGADFADGFLSADGRRRALGVETFGGGTWITNLSLLTGLSSADFGWQRPYLTIELENKVRGALPELLARCGYRTAAILPMDDAFVNEGPFLRSIGIETVLDAHDIGAGDAKKRDLFYYEAAARFIAEHRQTDRRPLFILVQTMFPHGPHHARLEPDVLAAGEPLHPEPELNEYLRRLWIARADFRGFLAAQGAAATGRGLVVLEFGDHQAAVTKPFVDALAGVDAVADLGSIAYTTHYTVHAFNYRLSPERRAFERLDVAFLGASFAERARLATSPLMADLIALRDRCNGLFHRCADRTAVDAHLRRRVDAGLLAIGPPAGHEALGSDVVAAAPQSGAFAALAAAGVPDPAGTGATLGE